MKHLKISIIITLLPLFSFAQSAKETGLTFINKLSQKQYTEAAAFFDENVKEQVTPQVLEQTEAAITQQLGSYKTNIETNEETEEEYNVIYYYSQFENQKLDIKLVFNTQNKIVGFFFVPHKEFDKKKQ